MLLIGPVKPEAWPPWRRLDYSCTTPSTFVQTNPGSDCGVVLETCGGLVAQATNGGVVASSGTSIESANFLGAARFTLGTKTYSVTITDGMLNNGRVSFIAEVAGESWLLVGSVLCDPYD